MDRASEALSNLAMTLAYGGVYLFLAVVIAATLFAIYMFIGWTCVVGQANREKLKHGSVLSPNTHPSFSPKKMTQLSTLDRDYATRKEQLDAEFTELRAQA